MQKLTQIAWYLIERETITGEEFMSLLKPADALPESAAPAELAPHPEAETPAAVEEETPARETFPEPDATN